MAKTGDTTSAEAAVEEQGAPARPWLTLSRVWAVMAVGLPVAILLGRRIPTVDIAYLIRAGNIMFRTHHVLRSDTFTFTVADRAWLNQQWGAEVLFAALYRLGGWPILGLLRGICGAVTFLLVFLSCRGRGASTKQAAWLTLGFSALGFGGFLVRPQMFGLVLFALTMWILVEKERRPRLLYAIPVIVAVWANLHGSFFLGPLLVGLAFLEDVRRKSPQARRLLLLAVVSAAAANIGPFGFKVWTYALNISTNPAIANHISEWQPPSVRDLVGALFFVSVAAAATILARSRRRVPWTSLLTLGLFFLIGLFAVRGVFWWAIIAPSILVGALPVKSDAKSPAGDRTANRAMVALIGILIVGVLPWWRLIGASSTASALLDRAPVGITNAAARLAPPGTRVFVDQPIGSWFEFAVPGRPIFVDSRNELFSESLWNQYIAITGGRADWDRLLHRWRVDVVVAERGDQRDLIPFIRRSPRWRLAYEDRDGLVFVRAR